MDWTIDDFELSETTYNSLKRAGINKVGDLYNRNQEGFMWTISIGRKSLDELLKKSEAGFILK